MKLRTLSMNILTAGSLLAGTALAAPDDEKHQDHHKNHKAQEQQGIAAEKTLRGNQKNCPVMGGKVNKDLYVDAEGKRIYVCCKGCLPTVRKNPEKYINTLEKQGVTLEPIPKETVKGNQKNCPVMGGKVNEDLYVDAEGKRIYVCCKGCLPTVRKNPEKYINTLEKQGVTLEPAPDEEEK